MAHHYDLNNDININSIEDHQNMYTVKETKIKSESVNN